MSHFHLCIRRGIQFLVFQNILRNFSYGVVEKMETLYLRTPHPTSHYQVFFTVYLVP